MGKLSTLIWASFRFLHSSLIQLINLTDSRIPIRANLPVDWTWEVIDEFVYQFQEFSQFSSKMKDLSISDITLLKENKVWNVVSTLKYLQRFVQKSEVKQTLENEKLYVKLWWREHIHVSPLLSLSHSSMWISVSFLSSRGIVSSGQSAFASSELYHYLGYWSLLGLCRMHVLLGDYYLAVKTLDPIQIHSKVSFILTFINILN